MDELYNNLDPVMQARLDKWRQNTIPVKSAELLKGKQPNFVPRQRDYGDDMSDYDRKEQNIWNKEYQNNRGY